MKGILAGASWHFTRTVTIKNKMRSEGFIMKYFGIMQSREFVASFVFFIATPAMARRDYVKYCRIKMNAEEYDPKNRDRL